MNPPAPLSEITRPAVVPVPGQLPPLSPAVRTPTTCCAVCTAPVATRTGPPLSPSHAPGTLPAPPCGKMQKLRAHSIEADGRRTTKSVVHVDVGDAIADDVCGSRSIRRRRHPKVRCRQVRSQREWLKNSLEPRISAARNRKRGRPQRTSDRRTPIPAVTRTLAPVRSLAW